MTTRDARVFDDRPCHLGEGPLWHPLRQQLFWFDVLQKRLLSRDASGPLVWQFDECVSAAGWIDENRLLIASETALFDYDLTTGQRRDIVPLEADKPGNRSNDGRADPWGGFWIGTMGKSAEPGAGAIYRYRAGRITRLFDGITIPNSICFSPDRRIAYFADSLTHKIMRTSLDTEGWPTGDPQVFVDLASDQTIPDGSVTDTKGYVWNAQWGAGRVARYAPDGRLDRILPVGGRHSSCPAFGGPGGQTLYVTTAREHMAEPGELDGLVFVAETDVKGVPETRVEPGVGES